MIDREWIMPYNRNIIEVNLDIKNLIINKSDDEKSTTRNCNQRRWGSGSHWQGIFGSASLS